MNARICCVQCFVRQAWRGWSCQDFAEAFPFGYMKADPNWQDQLDTKKLHHCCNVWFGYGQLFFCLKKGLVAAWKCFAAIQQNPWFSSSLWYKCQLLLHSDRLDGWCEAEYIDALPGFKRKHHDIKVIDGELRFKLGSFKPDRRLGFFGNCWFGGWWNSSDHFWKLHLSGRLGRYHKTSLYHGIDSWD